MRMKMLFWGLLGSCLATSAVAQTPVVDGGTASGNAVYTVPIFTGSATLGSSNITQTSNFIGMFNPYPLQPLSVNGTIFSGYSVGAYMIPDFAGSNGYMQRFGINTYFDGSNWRLTSDGSNNAGSLITGNHAIGDMRFYTFPDTGGSIQSISTGDLENYRRMTITNDGSIGVGTSAPGSKLEINGNVKLTSGSGASITFADGTVQSTAWTGTLCGGDYAESVDASGPRVKYQPGDVLVLSGDTTMDVSKSRSPYSSLVSGIYSTKPGMVGRRQQTQDKSSEIPMAMIAIVPTKVTTENGPIKRGDLLVTSSTEGYAMKGTDHSRMLGAVIGSLDSGKGLIEVLVSLQ